MADETIRAILDLQNQEYLAAANQVVLENRSLATSFDEVAAAARAETLAMENTSSALSAQATHHGDLGRATLSLDELHDPGFYITARRPGVSRALSAIQNNIPQTVMALGMGGGLAGAISVVSVGAGLLVSNWGKLNDWWKGEETEKEAKRMEELAKHTKEARQATEKLLTARSPEEKRPGAAIDKAIAEFGGPAVNREIVPPSVPIRVVSAPIEISRWSPIWSPTSGLAIQRASNCTMRSCDGVVAPAISSPR